MAGRNVAFCRTTIMQVCCLATLAGAIWGGYVLFRASRALSTARRENAAEADIRFTAARLARAQTSFEPVFSPAVFHDAVVYRGSTILCSPSGLLEYSPEGTLTTQYRTGPDLPSAPTAISVGVLADATEPELLVGTAGDGLIAFDGRRFRQIRGESAAARDLTALLPLSTGRVLLGTEKNGILVYDGKRLTTFDPALAAEHVTALAGDESGVWVGTTEHGVFHWRAGATEHFGEQEGLPDSRVLSQAVSGDAVFVGTPGGVAEFRAGRFTRVLAPNVFAQSLLVHEGRLLIGTLEQGIVEAALGTGRGRRNPAPLSLEAAVFRLFEESGSLYAVANDGLYRVDERRGAWQRVIERGPAVLRDGNISALAFDGAGRLWVGYFDHGLDILDPGLTRAVHIEDDHVFCVNRIVHDPARGLTAVATANGLVMFDSSGRPRQTLGRGEGLIANHVTDVVVGNGGMTVATPAGLTFLDAGGARSLYAFHGLVNNHVYALGGGHGQLLAGTLGGLSVLEDEAVRRSYTASNSGLKHNWVTAIAAVDDGWFVGTYGAGVLKLDGSGAWHTFPDLREPFEVNPNAMLATPAAVYAGSLSNGMYIYDVAAGRWRHVRSGLPSASVTAFAARNGIIYAGTANGLVRFPENSR